LFFSTCPAFPLFFPSSSRRCLISFSVEILVDLSHVLMRSVESPLPSRLTSTTDS
jgi:hypothetical protein